MKKQIRFWLSLLFLLLVGMPSLSAYAAETRVYTIKQGDTLWGISERFVKDPYYWPNLWANNPDITNPHLIYPGQQVRVYNGRIELIPEYQGTQNTAPEPAPAPAPAVEQPKPAVEKAPAVAVEEPAPEPVAEHKIEMFKGSGSGDGFIRTDEQALGAIVDSVDSRVLLTQNDLVFLRMNDPQSVKVGDTYSLFGRGPEVIHPLTKKPFGTMMYDLGNVQITEIQGSTIVGKIGDVYREIERGAEVFEYIEPTLDIELKKASGELAGNIISGQQSKLTQGQNDIVYVDLGRNNGLQVGNMLIISRPRTNTELVRRRMETLENLPDALLGAAVVVETHSNTAAALIFKSSAEMHVGDQVMAATE